MYMYMYVGPHANTKYYNLNLWSLDSIAIHLNPSTNNKVGHVIPGDNHYCYAGTADLSVYHSTFFVMGTMRLNKCRNDYQGTHYYLHYEHRCLVLHRTDV
jgi:hypothetical protein